MSDDKRKLLFLKQFDQKEQPTVTVTDNTKKYVYGASIPRIFRVSIPTARPIGKVVRSPKPLHKLLEKLLLMRC